MAGVSHVKISYSRPPSCGATTGPVLITVYLKPEESFYLSLYPIIMKSSEMNFELSLDLWCATNSMDYIKPLCFSVDPS